MEKMRLYTTAELLDEDLGPVGTPERDEFERQVAEEIHAKYFANKALNAIDKMWDEGKIDEGMMQAWKNEHMRTHR